MKRVKYIDGFRGFALLSMVVLHIYNALAYSSIYTDAPFFIKVINAPLINPPALFSFVSGMSVYLMVHNKLKSELRVNIAKKVIKCYGKYILLSLPFTIFMWGLTTYLQFNEAIEGIGLSAIIVSLIIIYFKPKKFEMIVSIFLMSITRWLLINSQLGDLFPYVPNLNNIPSVIGSVFLNALYRGYFSILNLVPIMLGGILFFKATKKGNPLMISLILTIASIILHFNCFPINYYTKTINLTFWDISSSCLTLSVILIPYHKEWHWITKPLTISGFASLFLYIGHQLIIIKPLTVFAENSLPEWLAMIIALIITFIFYKIAEHRLKRKLVL